MVVNAGNLPTLEVFEWMAETRHMENIPKVYMGKKSLDSHGRPYP